MKLKIVGMIPVFNEVDIVRQVLGHLIEQGIELVIIDNGSTDGSYEVCSEFEGVGVAKLKRISTERFEIAFLLKSLHDMALELEPDWILLCSADEFPESPYRGMTLKEAVELEAERGYNLIPFNNFEFYPTEEDEGSTEPDVRKRLRYYTWHDDYQFRCWKNYPEMTVNEYGGHRPKFPPRVEVKVSPNKFVLRHYKIRSFEHGMRKVFDERLPRYPPVARRMGWHTHYDNLKRDKSYFVVDSKKLTKYNEDGNWNLTKTFDTTFGTWNPPSAAQIMEELQKDVERLRANVIEKEKVSTGPQQYTGLLFRAVFLAPLIVPALLVSAARWYLKRLANVRSFTKGQDLGYRGNADRNKT